MKLFPGLLTGIGLLMMTVATANAQAGKNCKWGGDYSEGSRKCVCIVHRDERSDKTRHWHIIGVPYVCKNGQWTISAVPDSGHEKCVDIEYKSVDAAAVAINSPVIAAVCRQD